MIVLTKIRKLVLLKDLSLFFTKIDIHSD